MPRTLLKTQKPLGISHFAASWRAGRTHSRSQKLYEKRGQRMAIYANDLIGIEINQFGYYENEILDILFEFLAPLSKDFKNGVALDIGANIGNHTIYFSKHFNSIHSFEPNPYTYTLLAFNLNWVKTATAHNYGLGDIEGTFNLVENHTNFGGSSISLDESKNDSALQIHVERLDNITINGDLCFVKIDVEGFEEKVLKGGVETFKKHEPIIALEQLKREFRGDSTQSIKFLIGLGYKLCWHERSFSSNLWLIKRINNLLEIVFGRRHKIVLGDSVPARSHSMIIAIPPRFQSKLGIN